jgi:hypothetical protein
VLLGAELLFMEYLDIERLALEPLDVKRKSGDNAVATG